METTGGRHRLKDSRGVYGGGVITIISTQPLPSSSPNAAVLDDDLIHNRNCLAQYRPLLIGNTASKWCAAIETADDNKRRRTHRDKNVVCNCAEHSLPPCNDSIGDKIFDHKGAYNRALHIISQDVRKGKGRHNQQIWSPAKAAFFTRFRIAAVV